MVSQKQKKEIEGIPFTISICKEKVSPEEHKRRKTELFFFLLEQGKKITMAGLGVKNVE